MTTTPLIWKDKSKPSGRFPDPSKPPARWKAQVGSWTLQIKRTGSSRSGRDTPPFQDPGTRTTGRYLYHLRMRSKAQQLDIACGPYRSLAAAQRYAQAAVDQYRLAIEPAAWNTPTDPAPKAAQAGGAT